MPSFFGTRAVQQEDSNSYWAHNLRIQLQPRALELNAYYVPKSTWKSRWDPDAKTDMSVEIYLNANKDAIFAKFGPKLAEQAFADLEFDKPSNAYRLLLIFPYDGAIVKKMNDLADVSLIRRPELKLRYRTSWLSGKADLKTEHVIANPQQDPAPSDDEWDYVTDEENLRDSRFRNGKNASYKSKKSAKSSPTKKSAPRNESGIEAEPEIINRADSSANEPHIGGLTSDGFDIVDQHRETIIHHAKPRAHEYRNSGLTFDGVYVVDGVPQISKEPTKQKWVPKSAPKPTSISFGPSKTASVKTRPPVPPAPASSPVDDILLLKIDALKLANVGQRPALASHSKASNTDGTKAPKSSPRYELNKDFQFPSRRAALSPPRANQQVVSEQESRAMAKRARSMAEEDLNRARARIAARRAAMELQMRKERDTKREGKPAEDFDELYDA